MRTTSSCRCLSTHSAPSDQRTPTEPSGDCPSGGSCAIYIGMSSIRSIHSIRRTKSLRKSLATNFFGPFPQEIGRHKTFSAHFLEKSAVTKLFRLISSGNRSLQTFSAHFLRKSAVTKLFRLISSGNRPPQNFFGSFPQEIGRHKTFSAKSLRKSTATSEKEGIEDGPQENGIFFGLLRDIVEILFACYRNGSIFAAVSWHM